MLATKLLAGALYTAPFFVLSIGLVTATLFIGVGPGGDRPDDRERPYDGRRRLHGPTPRR